MKYKSKILKLITLGSFVIILFGCALWMYFTYIHNKPKIQIVTPRTNKETQHFDSLLKTKPKFNK
ncbi:MAG: hypothetical protein HQ463_02510 [Bacteroidetes bacterium]|nr:hypothetical protein [Bacteroidota bacterium]